MERLDRWFWIVVDTLIIVLLLSLLIGCASEPRNNDYYYRSFSSDYQPRNEGYRGYTEAYQPQCHHHTKEPLYRQEYEPPLYKRRLLGNDNCGYPMYEEILVKPGRWVRIRTGWHCRCCGRGL